MIYRNNRGKETILAKGDLSIPAESKTRKRKRKGNPFIVYSASEAEESSDPSSEEIGIPESLNGSEVAVDDSQRAGEDLAEQVAVVDRRANLLQSESDEMRAALQEENLFNFDGPPSLETIETGHESSTTTTYST